MLLLSVLVSLSSVGCSGGDSASPQAASPSSVAGLPPVTTASGLKFWVLKEGAGAAPTTGQTVSVHYTGWLKDGSKFDSSVDRGDPLAFAIGIGKVIPGWDEGVGTMKIGEKRQLEIPPQLGYGDKGAGGVIPPGATLVFDVELMGIE